MPNLPEAILSLVAGHDRAAAMMGDLSELAATRGPRWFIAAYVSTLLSLTWRNVAAFLAALVVGDLFRQFVFVLANLFFRRHTVLERRPPVFPPVGGPYLLSHMPLLMACIMSTLWFVLPFAVVRYGVRDRFVRLTFAVAVGATMSFLFVPWISPIAAASTVVFMFAAAIARPWRRALETLLVTGASGIAILAAYSALQYRIMHGPALPFSFLHGFRESLFIAALLALAVVFSSLHRWLLGPPAGRTLA